MFVLNITFCYASNKEEGNTALYDILVHCEDTLNKDRQQIDQIIDALYPLTESDHDTDALQVASSLYLSLAIQQKQAYDYNKISSRKQLHQPELSQIDYWSETQYRQFIYQLLESSFNALSKPIDFDQSNWSLFIAGDTSYDDFHYVALKSIYDQCAVLTRPSWFRSAKPLQGEFTALKEKARTEIERYLKQSGQTSLWLNWAYQSIRSGANYGYDGSQQPIRKLLWALYDSQTDTNNRVTVLYWLTMTYPVYGITLDQEEGIANLYGICQQAEKAYPKTHYMPSIRNWIKQMQSGRSLFQARNTYTSKQSVYTTIQERNYAQVAASLKNGTSLVKQISRKFDKTPVWQTTYDTVRWGELPYGKYTITNDWTATNKLKSNDTVPNTDISFAVTDLYPMLYIDKEIILQVNNTVSGNAESGVEVSVYTINDRKLIAHATTSSKGICKIEGLAKGTGYVYTVSKGNDKYYPETTFYLYNNNQPAQQRTTTVITDRGIYEPGDSICFGAVLAQQNTNDSTEKTSLLANKTVKAMLQYEGTKIDQLELRSDDWGFVSGGFKLSKTAVGGNYQVQVANGQATVEVSEFRSPEYTFDLSYSRTEEGVNVVGKASSYASMGVDKQRVSCVVGNNIDLANSTVLDTVVYTNKEGQCVLPLSNALLSQVRNGLVMVQCRMTTTMGEVVSKSILFPAQRQNRLQVTYEDASYESASNRVQLLEVGDALTVSLKLTTAENQHEHAEGKVWLRAQKDTTQQWLLGEVATDRSISYKLPQSVRANPQTYQLHFKLHTSLGDTLVQDAGTIAFFDKKTEQLPYDAPLILCYAPDGTAYVGSNTQHVISVIQSTPYASEMLAQVRSNGKMIKLPQGKAPKNASNSQYWLTASVMDDENLAVLNLNVASKDTKNALQIIAVDSISAFEVGKKHTWRFRVMDGYQRGVKAHVSATMYNEALDLIKANNWNAHIQSTIAPFMPRVFYYQNRWQYDNTNQPFAMEEQQPQASPYLNPFCFSQVTAEGFMPRTRAGGPYYMLNAQPEKSAKTADAANTANEWDIPLRKDDGQLAFFLPNLVTDETGHFEICFDAPEQLSVWALQILAYDQQGNSSVDTLHVRSKKAIRLNAHVPEFLRNGDEVYIQAGLTTDSVQTGSFAYRLIDIDNSTVISEKVTQFRTQENETLVMPIKITVPKITRAIRLEFYALADGGARDGLQYAIPIYPTRRFVTKSKPFQLQDTNQKNVVFETFMREWKRSNIDNVAYTLKYNDSPVDNLLEIIPLLNKENQEVLTGVVADFYFNTMLKGLAADKHYAATFERYKQSAISKGNNTSTVLTTPISQTPWMAVMRKEQEKTAWNAEQLSDSVLSKHAANSIRALLSFQQPSGGFAWSKQEQVASAALTNYVLVCIGELISLGCYELDGAMHHAAYQAVLYSDSINAIREKDQTIGQTDLEWLYMRSMYRDIPFAGKSLARSKQIVESLKNRSFASADLKELAYATIVLNRYGQSEQAQTLAKQIIARATISNNWGMYWENNTDSEGNAIEVQVLMIEALRGNAAYKGYIEQMKYWILTQKNRQMWQGVAASMRAMYALLQGQDKLPNANTQATIEVGSYTLLAQGPEYAIDTTIQHQEIKENLGRVRIHAQDPVTAFGALYWQYYDDINRITQQDRGLSIARNYYRVWYEGDKRQVEKVTEDNLFVGDQVIVELLIQADSRYDFVYLVDERPAILLPTQQIVSYGYEDGLSYVSEHKVNDSRFYIERLPKGKYQLTYETYVGFKGDVTAGIATIESYLSPAYRGNTTGKKIRASF